MVGEAVVSRMVAALRDYDSLRVDEVRLDGVGGFEIVVHDLRIEVSYRICSRSDYWDFLARFVDRGDWIVGRVDHETGPARQPRSA